MTPQKSQFALSRQNVFVNITLSSLTTFLFLFALELLLRFFVPQWALARNDQRFWRYDPLLGWAHAPHTRGSFSHTDFSVTVSINSKGLRGPDYPTARVNGKKRLLVLGDSFGWGFGVEDNEVFTSILQTRFPSWEIINASVSGYGTDQELLYYQDRGVHYRPDVVLLLFYQNDIDDNTNTEFQGYNKPQFQILNGRVFLTNAPVPAGTWRQNIQRFLLTHTILLARFYSAGITLKEHVFRHTAVSASTDTDLNYELTKSILFYLDNLVRQNNARLVVVSAPTRLERLRRFLGHSLSSKGILYLPLDEAFANVTGTAHFEHDHHWNPAGHRIAAQAIEAFLIQHRILPTVAAISKN